MLRIMKVERRGECQEPTRHTGREQSQCPTHPTSHPTHSIQSTRKKKEKNGIVGELCRQKQSPNTHYPPVPKMPFSSHTHREEKARQGEEKETAGGTRQGERRRSRPEVGRPACPKSPNTDRGHLKTRATATAG